MADRYQTNISTKSYRGIQVCSLHTIEEILVDVGKSQQKKCVEIKIVSPRQAHLDKMCQHLAVMATCHQHVGNFINQALQ